MLLIPVMDIKGGKCVTGAGTAKSRNGIPDDPAALARQWIEAGVRRLQVNDLDGLAGGRPANVSAVRRVAEVCGEVPLQVSGGLRSEENVQAYIDAGAHFVVLGMRAAATPHFVNDLCLEFPGHIMIGLDVRDGKVAAEGWSKMADNDALEAAEHFQREGAAAILFTAVTTKGPVDGACLDGAAAVARAIAIPVIAGGGVRTLEDVRGLKPAAGEGVFGTLLGREILDGTLDLAAALKLADGLV